MKKVFLSAITTFLFLICIFSNVFAETVNLPDGGSTKNSKVDTVTGRTSGGVDGYANMICTIVAYQGSGWINDYAIATVDSDVKTIKSAYTIMYIYYTTTSGGTSNTTEGRPSSNVTPFSMRVTALNQYATKAVAGHSVTYETRGTWNCGTTVIFQ